MTQIGDMPPAEAIDTHLDDVDVISFDIFDTLFLRPFTDAEHVFDLVGQRHGIGDFRAIRQQAQREAFQEMHRQGRHEIDLALIYDQMPPALATLADTLMQTEITLEHLATQPNEPMLAVFRRLVDEGRTVVLTSDMYLRGDFFAKLLDDYDLPRVPVFVSADYDATKRDHGALFDVVADRTAVSPHRILHVGDNVRADIEMAQAKGLRTVHYQEAFLPPRLKDINLVESLARGLSRFGGQTKGDAYFQLGYELGGPAALGLLRWIEERARTEGIEHLLLVSRDGYILNQIIEAATDRFDLPRISYFRGSRVAFKLAAMNEKNFVSFLPFLLSGSAGLSVDELFWRIGVPAPADKVLEDIGLPQTTRVAATPQQDILRLMMAMRPQILKVARDCRRGLRLYLHDLGIKSGDKVGFVDVGWNGTTQEALTEALTDMMSLDLHGYYLCLSNLPECKVRKARASMSALLDEANLTVAELAKIYDHRVIAEFFFSAPHLPVIGYQTDTGTRIEFVEDAGRSLDEVDIAARVTSVQNGMLAFARDFLDQSDRLGLVADAEGLCRPLIDFLCAHGPDTHSAFSDMKGFDAWGSSRNLSL